MLHLNIRAARRTSETTHPNAVSFPSFPCWKAWILVKPSLGSLSICLKTSSLGILLVMFFFCCSHCVRDQSVLSVNKTSEKTSVYISKHTGHRECWLGWGVLIHQWGGKNLLSIFAEKRSLHKVERPHYGNGMFCAERSFRIREGQCRGSEGKVLVHKNTAKASLLTEK